MSKFTDILNSPLPSKVSTIQESADDNAAVVAPGEETKEENKTPIDTKTDAPEPEPTDVKEGTECGKACEDGGEDVGTDDIDDIATGDDEDDIDSLSEEELAALDKELGDDALDSVVDDEEEVTLSADEEMKADDMMNIAATSLLVNDELNAEEKANFVSTEAAVAVAEGFMTDSDVNQMSSDLGLVQENNYNKKMIIRLDAESKKKQLYALAVNVSAAAHGDPDYYKLKKVMKMRKILRAKLEQKYKGEATKRMRIYFNRLKRSKSNTLSNIGNKVDK